mgnify:CR=1 FL=1
MVKYNKEVYFSMHKGSISGVQQEEMRAVESVTTSTLGLQLSGECIINIINGKSISGH